MLCLPKIDPVVAIRQYTLPGFITIMTLIGGNGRRKSHAMSHAVLSNTRLRISWVFMNRNGLKTAGTSKA